MNEKVDIEIFRRRLTVEMEGLTPLEIDALARKVHEHMTEIGARYKEIADSSKLAILATLHLAAELEQTRQARSTEKTALERKVEELTLILRASLTHAKK